MPFLIGVHVHCALCVWQSTDTQIDVLYQTLVCHASSHNSVLDDIADENTGPLRVLGDVTLE